MQHVRNTYRLENTLTYEVQWRNKENATVQNNYRIKVNELSTNFIDK